MRFRHRSRRKRFRLWFRASMCILFEFYYFNCLYELIFWIFFNLRESSLVNAATGTGKTIVYLAPIVHLLQMYEPRIERSNGTFGIFLWYCFFSECCFNWRIDYISAPFALIDLIKCWQRWCLCQRGNCVCRFMKFYRSCYIVSIGLFPGISWVVRIDLKRKQGYAEVWTFISEIIFLYVHGI